MLSKPIILSQFPNQSFIVRMWKIGGSQHSDNKGHTHVLHQTASSTLDKARQNKVSFICLPHSQGSRRGTSPFAGPRCIQDKGATLAQTRHLAENIRKPMLGSESQADLPTFYYGQGNSSDRLMRANCVQLFPSPH